MVTESDYMPYMEKSSFAQKAGKNERSRIITSLSKQNKDHGLSLQLGKDYERKKQKLKEELRLDYRCYVSEVRLPDERIKDYSPLLRGDEEMQRIRKTSNTPQTSVKGCSTSTASYHPSFSSKPQRWRSPERLHSSKRDNQYEPEPIYEPSGLEDTHMDRPRRLRRLRSGTNMEPNYDEEEHEKQNRRPKYCAEHAQVGRRPRKLQHRTDGFSPETREVEEAPAASEDDQEENRQISPAPIQANVRAPTQSRAGDTSVTAFATGLMIGVAEREGAVQRRKELYRQELLEQIAEQRRNKKKEKELELRVAATGAIDPEKGPDRIKQYGASRTDHAGRRQDGSHQPAPEPDTHGENIGKKSEAERGPPEKPRVAFQSPVLGYDATLGHLANTTSTGVLNNTENFPKDFPGAIGGLVVPRVAGFPPLAPTVAEAYSTPYDAAYYYYGARNPIDPNLAFYGPLAVHPSPYFPARTMPTAHQPPIDIFQHSASHQAISPSEIGNRAPPTVHSPHPMGHVPSYKDSLQQQIEERQKRRTQEMEEKERFEAKLEAEMKAYEPWGKGGAGAPLRDDQGNLICDLKHMHITNKAAYVNPDTCNRGTTASVDQAETTARAEDLVSTIHSVSDKDSSLTRPSPFARGNVFPEHMTPQQIREQERYKQSLKQQIEEKQQIEAERRARLKLEEEKEEKRLAEERAHLQRQYQEEQENEKRKEMEKMAKKQEVIQQAEEQHRAAQKKREEEKANKALKQCEQERDSWLEKNNFRSNSPPIPTIRNKLARQVPLRPPSTESQQSAAALSVQSISTPQSPFVPAKRNQIRAAEKQGVIRELSVMRELLRSEQKKLDRQLVKSDREDTHLNSRAHPRSNAFDMAMLQMQVPSSNSKPLKKQIMQDFSQLKYRDNDSREEVKQAYPKGQQRRLNNLQREIGIDYFDLSSTMNPAQCRLQKDSCVEAERNTPLESESAFIDANGYAFSITPTPDRTSARQRRRQARTTDFSDGVATNSRKSISHSRGSTSNFQPDQVRVQNQSRMRALDGATVMDQKSGRTSADKDGDLWQRTRSSPLDGHVSTTTEAWLCPSTTETLKKLMAGHGLSSCNLPTDEWDAASPCYG